MFILKPGAESFEMVDGPMAGQKFLRGKAYKEIPPEEANKFEKIEKRKEKIEKSKATTKEPDKGKGSAGDDVIPIS